MSLIGFNFNLSSHPNGVDVDLLELELDAAWSGAVTFSVIVATIGNIDRHGRPIMGNIQIDTVETLDSGQIAAWEIARDDHLPALPVVDWQLAGPLPRNPHIGRVLYLSDVDREGAGGPGALCYYDGADWRRVSDDAVAA